MLLSKFPDIFASSIDNFAAAVPRDALDWQVGSDDVGSFSFRSNIATFQDVTLIWSSCNTATTLRFADAPYMRHVFQLAGSTQFSWDGTSILNNSDMGGTLVKPGVRLTMENAPDYESISVRIAPAALKRKLSALLAEDVSVPEFLCPELPNDARMGALRAATLALARELDFLTGAATVAVTEIVDSLISRFLVYHSHDYTQRLDRCFQAPSKKQVDRIEEFILANWDKALKVEDIAAEIDVAPRTIFRIMKSERGYSPARLVRDVRLDKAHEILSFADTDQSVLSTALKCGFQSFGHFSREYSRRFGELPSVTLKKKRSRRD